MYTPIGLEHCVSYINCQLQGATHPLAVPANHRHRRAVTISRQTGSGGHAVASALAELLTTRSPEGSCPWTIFDRNLVEKVLEDHKLPARLAKFMPEDKISALSDTMDELFGLHPPSSILVRDTTETVLRLADLGNVIIIGRAAHIITARLDYVFHVRLVGSIKRRVEYLCQSRQLDEKTAQAILATEDAARRRYLKTYFNRDIDDPLLYHLVINTDVVTYDEAARIIADQTIPAKPPAKAKPSEAPLPA